MKDYILAGIKTRYDSIESQRSEKEEVASPEPCFFEHGGVWDVAFQDISDRVSNGLLAVAQNQQQADKLLNVIFERLQKE